MDVSLAKEKYLHKIVRHKTRNLLFEITRIYIKDSLPYAKFRHMFYATIPKGQPGFTSIFDLEENWEIIPET